MRTHENTSTKYGNIRVVSLLYRRPAQLVVLSVVEPQMRLEWVEFGQYLASTASCITYYVLLATRNENKMRLSSRFPENYYSILILNFPPTSFLRIIKLWVQLKLLHIWGSATLLLLPNYNFCVKCLQQNLAASGDGLLVYAGWMVLSLINQYIWNSYWGVPLSGSYVINISGGPLNAIVRSVVFGMLIDQISCGANFMLSRPQLG